MYYISIAMLPKGGADPSTYTNIVHHHLIQTTGAKRALYDICDGLGSGDYTAGLSAGSAERQVLRLVLTALVSDIGTRDLLSSKKQGAVSRLLEHRTHDGDIGLKSRGVSEIKVTCVMRRWLSANSGAGIGLLTSSRQLISKLH